MSGTNNFERRRTNLMSVEQIDFFFLDIEGAQSSIVETIADGHDL
jgi:hypothetical protein